MKKNKEETTEKSVKKMPKYIGPAYNTGLTVGDKKHRPAEVPAENVEAYLKKYPEMRQYFG